MNHLATREAALNGTRVLLVEDDFILLVELEFILAEAGAEVVGMCRTIGEAVAFVEREDFAAAVLDIRLGQETISPVARRLTQRGIPFVFYTGQVETDPIRAEWPACRIVPKPAQPRAIVAAVTDLLRRH